MSAGVAVFPLDLLRRAAQYHRQLMVYVGSWSDIRNKSNCRFGDLVLSFTPERDDPDDPLLAAKRRTRIHKGVK